MKRKIKQSVDWKAVGILYASTLLLNTTMAIILHDNIIHVMLGTTAVISFFVGCALIKIFLDLLD